MTRPALYAYASFILALLVLSAIDAHELGTWAMEVEPVFIALPLMMATHRRFPLTPLLYSLIAAHMVVLMVGGHYTYARAPLGFWMEEAFGFTRNHYDRIGHLMQVPGSARWRRSDCSAAGTTGRSRRWSRSADTARAPLSNLGVRASPQADRAAADYTCRVPRSVARHVSVPGSEFIIATALTRTMVLRG